MANERWNDDIAYAMNYIKLVSWPIGVWPLQVYNTFSIIRCALGILSSIMMVLLSLTEIFMGCTNAEQNIDCLMLICCGTLGIMKTITFRIYANNLTDNFTSAVNDYKTVKDPRDYSIMRKHTYIGKMLSYCLLGSSYFSCVFLTASPFLGVSNADPTNATNETVMDVVPQICALQYLHVPTNMHTIALLVHIPVMFICCTTNIGNDSLFVSITLHLCGQVKVLNANFVDFDTASLRDYDRLNMLIKRHIYLIDKAKKLTETVNNVLLVQLCFISILICIVGFQFILAMKMNDVVIIGKSLVLQVVFLTEIFLYSFIGDYLISQMEKTAVSVYQTAWYKFSDNAKRNIIFVIMRRESPVALLAGNFIMINLETFMSILKTALSYLSVLRVMVET